MSTKLKVSLKHQTVTNIFEEKDPDEHDVNRKSDNLNNTENSVIKKEEPPDYLDTEEYIEEDDYFGENFDPPCSAKIDFGENYDPEGSADIDFGDNLDFDQSSSADIDASPEDSVDLDFVQQFSQADKSTNGEEHKFVQELGEADKLPVGPRKKKRAKVNFLMHREDPTAPEDSKQTEEEIKRRESSASPTADDLTRIDCCDENPNFAVLIDFMEKFGEVIGIKNIPIKDLQQMLTAQGEPHPDLVQLHIVLLRKIRLPKIIITKKSWCRALIMFCSGAGDMLYEGLELQNLGYEQLSLSVKLELLKGLMEGQFIWNDRLRTEIDELPVEELRNEPMGKDLDGQIYWTQIDDCADIRIYTEDYRHFTWLNCVQNRVELVNLLKQLKDVKLYKMEMERLQLLETKEKASEEIVDAIEIMEKERDINPESSKSFQCEVCRQEFESKNSTLEHYSQTHMLIALEEKFNHLSSSGQCKICHFQAEEGNAIWIHIGTEHEKVNAILKEKGLKQIEERVQKQPDENITTEKNTENSDIENSTEADSVLQKIEEKIAALKTQMNISIDDTQILAEDPTTDNEENNQPDDDNSFVMENSKQTTPEPHDQIPNKDTNEIDELSENNSVDTDIRNNEVIEKLEQINDIDTNEDVKDDISEKNTDPTDNEVGSIKRSRPGRACKEKYEILKAAGSPPKRGKKLPLKEDKIKSTTEEENEEKDTVENETIEKPLNLEPARRKTANKRKATPNKKQKKAKQSKKAETKDEEKESKPIKNEFKVDIDDKGDDKEILEKSKSTELPVKGEDEKSLNDSAIKEEDDQTEINKSGRTSRKRKAKDDAKLIDVTSSLKIKQRKENKLSCKRCNEWKDGTDKVYSCNTCSLGWHQNCTIPPIFHQPRKDWQCPLCHHAALVQNLEQTLIEFDILMEKAEEKRLAALIENQNNQLQIESDSDTHSRVSTTPSKLPKISVQNMSPEINDVKRPDYFESSDDDDRFSGDSGEDDWQSTRSTCTCEGAGDCLFCKRLQGCTCEGVGTCRLCMSKKQSDTEVAPDIPPTQRSPRSPTKMSTTELFLLTGQTRQVEVEVQEEDGFVFRGSTRGSSRGRSRGPSRRGRKPRGSRNSGGLGRGSPSGIIVLDNEDEDIDNPRAITMMPRRPVGRVMMRRPVRRPMAPRGHVPINSQPVISYSPPKAEIQTPAPMIPRNRFPLRPRGSTHPGQVGMRPLRPRIPTQSPVIPFQQNAVVIQHQVIPQNMAPVQRGMRPQRPFSPRNVTPMHRGIRPQRQVVPRNTTPIQHGIRPQHQGNLRTVAPIQRGIRPQTRGGQLMNTSIPSSSGRGRPRLRGPAPQNTQYIDVEPIQKVVMPPRPRMAIQMGQRPMGRGNMTRQVRPRMIGQQGMRNIRPQPVGVRAPGQRPRMAGQLQYGERVVMQPRNIRPQQPGVARGYVVAPRQRFGVKQQPVMMNQNRGTGRPQSSTVTRPQQGIIMRGQQPMSNRRPRMRSRGGANPRMVVNQQQHFLNNQNSRNLPNPSNGHYQKTNADEDDIIIPTLNSSYQAPAPDFDIIAESEIQHFDSGRDDTNIMAPSTVTREEQANLARLPQYIQIEKVVEHEVVDLD